MNSKITPPGVGSTGNNGVTGKQSNFNTSTAVQRKTILDFLQPGNHLTTLHAREYLGIMHPAMRIKELRNEGYNIITHWQTEEDVTGTKHRIASYVLLATKSKEVA